LILKKFFSQFIPYGKCPHFLKFQVFKKKNIGWQVAQVVEHLLTKCEAELKSQCCPPPKNIFTCIGTIIK
jgi:hypothetical protein